MIFSPDMLQAVLEGRKTQTRRPWKYGDQYETNWDYGNLASPENAVYAVWRSKRRKWSLNKAYAVQPRQGAKGGAHIRLVAIRKERISDITDEDARAEGFADREGFFAKWRELYGDNADMTAWVWVLTFELVGGAA